MTEVTKAGRQLAADLANALELIGAQTNWNGGQPWTVPTIEADAKDGVGYAIAVKLLAEAKADLREIGKIAEVLSAAPGDQVDRIMLIAAKHRETDLLVEAWQAAWPHSPRCITEKHTAKLRVELSKRGIELKGVGDV